MTTCDECGERLTGSRECAYCTGTYCGDHRHPESHDCPGVEDWENEGGRFDSGFDDQ